MSSDIPHKGFEGCFIKALRHPVERRAEVVDKLLPRIQFMNRFRYLRRLLDTRTSSFHPQKVSIRSKLFRSFDRRR